MFEVAGWSSSGVPTWEVARSLVFLVVSVVEFPLLHLVVSSFSFLSSIGSRFSLLNLESRQRMRCTVRRDLGLDRAPCDLLVLTLSAILAVVVVDGVRFIVASSAKGVRLVWTSSSSYR